MRSEPKTLPASVPPRNAIRGRASPADAELGTRDGISARDTAHVTSRTARRNAASGLSSKVAAVTVPIVITFDAPDSDRRDVGRCAHPDRAEPASRLGRLFEDRL